MIIIRKFVDLTIKYSRDQCQVFQISNQIIH
jgi:hypothetical protein